MRQPQFRPLSRWRARAADGARLGLVALATVSNPPPIIAQGRPEVLTVDQWREDLDYMVEQVLLRHPNPFHYGASETAYLGAARALSDRIPRLSDGRIALELIAIHALLEDAHSEVEWTQIDDRLVRWGQYPFQLMLDSEGYFVSGAAPDHVDLLGDHVTHIESTPVARVYETLRPFISADNELNRSTVASGLMTVPHLLELLGIVADSRSISVSFRDGDGREYSRRFSPAGGEPVWVDASEVSSAPTPLWLRDRESFYWWEYLASERLVFLQLNRMQHKADDPLGDFADRVFAFMEAVPVDKFVLDLRHNRGGDNSVYWPLLHRIALSEINERGRFFTIIGRGSRSATPSFVARLEQLTNVILVGEPTAGRPNGHGGTSMIELPNSAIRLRCSGLFVRPTLVLDYRSWIPPEISAQITARAYSSNEDPALDAIIAYEPSPTFEEWVGTDWMDDVSSIPERYRAYRELAGNRWRDVRRDLNVMGRTLIEEDRIEEAILVLELAVGEYPNHWRAFDRLAGAYLARGRNDLAATMYRRSYTLNRMNVNALARLEELGALPDPRMPY